MKYLLSVVRGTSLMWIPLTTQNLEVLEKQGQRIDSEFVCEVNDVNDLDTKGKDFIQSILYRANNNLN